jgi:CheY-like chemotaxis protein
MEETIMVVEDEPDIRDIVATSLAIEGFRVLTAADSSDALEQLGAHPEVDLLFTDIIMPGDLHGYDLAREARQLCPSIKLLYTSGCNVTDVLEAHSTVAAARLVKKPYRLEQLLREIRATLAD